MINLGCASIRQTVASRALRGGSWNNSAGNARSAYRNQNHRGNHWNNTGFRLALSSCGHGGACGTRRRPDHTGCSAHQVANRQNPKVLVGEQVDACCRRLLGSSFTRPVMRMANGVNQDVA